MEGKTKQFGRVFTALYDIKPVTAAGVLDVERIEKITDILDLSGEKKKEFIPCDLPKEEPLNFILTNTDDLDVLPTREEILAELNKIENFEEFLRAAEEGERKNKAQEEKAQTSPLEEFYFPEVARGTVLVAESEDKKEVRADGNKSLFKFLMAGILIALIVPAATWVGYGFKIKEDVLSSGLSAYQNLLSAKQSLEESDWQDAEHNFGLARSDFFEAHQDINQLGRLTLGVLEQMPGGSLISSGSHLVKVGESLARAGEGLAAAVNLFSLNNLFNLADSIALSKDNLRAALTEIETANQEIEQIKIKSLPEDIQSGILFLKENLPLVKETLSQALDYSVAFLSILGHDNPRQYLLIFQNNGEARATGGFIGTYGLITLDRGALTNLFIDGIYNADGQLREKIIPPQPIQKISTAWSMHDANWFADFPTSAQKVAWFYEKTGGPTVDGVISLTPTVVERLLALTGPISMPEYGVELDASSFVELIQYKVETDYDKELNQPKKILADFAPKFIKQIGELSAEKKKEAIEIIFDCLEEKHILAYFSNPSLEKLADEEGWSGKILSTDKDYLSVVSSNINGYKTDWVIKETIAHQAEIQGDGSVIDTLTITRQHQGGDLAYDWWNRVNANYLRVYLPLGSQLISAEGQSLEIYQPPIDYEENNFKKDPLVEAIENSMKIDPKTGTRIFEESGKTVFANWAYVSPGETVVLTYKYKLPFKIGLTGATDSYSLLTQKQLGSLGSAFSHQLKFPSNWQVSWRYPETSRLNAGGINFNGDLKTDKFIGASFEF
ncbi:DUF4012 domain-containing protein [Patescibacteria group bacterium]|nr:DUF4012 domain-containing protein [Patescibacteria group bacterium]